MRKSFFTAIACCFILIAVTFGAIRQPDRAVASSAESGSREIPARTIPVPLTVSDELKKYAARSLDPQLGLIPNSKEQWRLLVSEKASLDINKFERLLERYPVNIEAVTIAGVKAHIVTPKEISPQNSNRLLLHLHGGGYVFNGGKVGLGEAVLMSYHGKFRIVSVDYRMAPDFPYPAALEDSISVYRELLKTTKPSRLAIFGTSSGGGLAAATVLKLQELGEPLPGSVGLGTPWVDFTKTGDTFFTLEYVDNVLGRYDGMLKACAELYAGSHDLRDKFISPVYADYTDAFPPTILTTGTRDLFLSDTVRLERKQRMAGVETRIQIFDGMSHAQYISAFMAPESKEAFEVMAAFFDKHLER